jgi:hypothetical protein
MEKRVEDMREHANRGNWDLLKSSTHRVDLVECILEFLRTLQKPIITNEEIQALSDITVSSAVERHVMGLMTALADLIS